MFDINVFVVIDVARVVKRVIHKIDSSTCNFRFFYALSSNISNTLDRHIIVVIKIVRQFCSLAFYNTEEPS
jgi:hypothetical protein